MVAGLGQRRGPPRADRDVALPVVQVQGTGEGGTFSRDQLQALLDLADDGIDRLGWLQRESLGADWPWP